MNRFEYAEPETLEQAISLLGETFDDAEVLAGGTDLLSLMKDFTVKPARLVGLSRIKALSRIERERDGFRIGAMATIDDLLESDVCDAFPMIRHAAEGIRSPQMRAMGTVGGELLQRPRCWYFRRGMGLLAVKDGASLVERGDNRYHAIFSDGGPARFVHASSLAPALIAASARVEIHGRKGARVIPVSELFRIPASDAEREHTVGPGEILTSILLSGESPHSATYEVRHRRGLDWPEVAAACALEMEGDRVKKASVVLGHVAPKPWATRAHEALVGQGVTPERADAAASLAVEGARPLSMNAHKVELARVAAKRAILNAAGQS